MKAANTSAFPVNGNSPSRHGEYFHKAVAVDNSENPVYQSIVSSAWLDALTNSTTGSVFVARSPEVFTYDADGNLTSDGQWNYKWDAENRLVQMESLAGVPTEAKRRLEFIYDYVGRRVQKTVSTNNGSAYVVCETSKYVYDGWNLVAILNPDLSFQKSFMWGLDASGTMQGAGGVGGLLSMTVHSGPQAGTYFTCYDGNHNLVGLIRGSDGAVVARYEYGPFGELIRATGPLAAANPFRFSTKFEDTESGLLYYGYRSYNPSTGRWLSRDPIGEKGGKNLYGFVRNASIYKYDPLGNRDGHYEYKSTEIIVTPRMVATDLCRGGPLKAIIHYWADDDFVQNGSPSYMWSSHFAFNGTEVPYNNLAADSSGSSFDIEYITATPVCPNGIVGGSLTFTGWEDDNKDENGVPYKPLTIIISYTYTCDRCCELANDLSVTYQWILAGGDDVIKPY